MIAAANILVSQRESFKRTSLAATFEFCPPAWVMHVEPFQKLIFKSVFSSRLVSVFSGR